jgi:hypothetical protein
MPRRSNSPSQAVRVVSGNAAAAAKFSVLRLVTDDALVDDVKFAVRARLLDASGVVNLVAGLNNCAPAPNSRTMPAASQPRIRGCGEFGSGRARIL